MKKLFPNNKVLPQNKSYDEIAKMVNDKLKQSENKTFGALQETNDELNLPSGTSFEMSGWSDYYAYMDGEDEVKRYIKFVLFSNLNQ